jgi:hypothetical protein
LRDHEERAHQPGGRTEHADQQRDPAQARQMGDAVAQAQRFLGRRALDVGEHLVQPGLAQVEAGGDEIAEQRMARDGALERLVELTGVHGGVERALQLRRREAARAQLEPAADGDEQRNRAGEEHQRTDETGRP